MRSCEPIGLLLLLAACGPGGPPGDTDAGELTYVDCVLGTPTEEGGFEPLVDGDPVELMLGFQGLLFVQIRVQLEEPLGEPCALTGTVTVDGLQPTPTNQPVLAFTAADPHWLSDTAPLFLASNSVAAYLDKGAELAVRVQSGQRACVVAHRVELVDEDPCIHSGTEPICPGDTGTP